MKLTGEERKQLGRAAEFLCADDAAAMLWRWLNAAAPYVPRSPGELYLAALRRLRETIRRTLEAEGLPGGGVSWLMEELFLKNQPLDGADRMAGEFRMDRTRAAHCLESLQAALARTPCLTEPVREALGSYLAAETFLGRLAGGNALGEVCPELLRPLPAPMLAAVSRLVYRKISAAEDPEYAVRLIRLLLGKRGSLRQDLANHGGGKVSWNMAAFYSGLGHETDVLELQRYTELTELLKAFTIVEYRVELAGKTADTGLTNALGGLALMMLGEHALRPSQKREIELEDGMGIQQVDPSDLEQRPDYLQAMFWLGLEECLPNGMWKKNFLRAYRTRLAFPSLRLSLGEWITLAVVLGIVIWYIAAVPMMRPAALMLLGLGAAAYLLINGGLTVLLESLRRIMVFVMDRFPILAVPIILACLYVGFRQKIPGLPEMDGTMDLRQILVVVLVLAALGAYSIHLLRKGGEKLWLETFRRAADFIAGHFRLCALILGVLVFLIAYLRCYVFPGA